MEAPAHALAAWTRPKAHHFMKHSLPSVDLRTVLSIFGVTSVETALGMLQTLKPSKLRELFNKIFKTETKSQNKVWLQRRLAEALQIRPSDCFPLQTQKIPRMRDPSSSSATSSDAQSSEMVCDTGSPKTVTSIARKAPASSRGSRSTTSLKKQNAPASKPVALDNVPSPSNGPSLLSIDSMPLMLTAPNPMADVSLHECSIDTAPSAESDEVAMVAELAANHVRDVRAARAAAGQDTIATIQRDPSWLVNAPVKRPVLPVAPELNSSGGCLKAAVEHEERAQSVAQLNGALFKLYACRQLKKSSPSFNISVESQGGHQEKDGAPDFTVEWPGNAELSDLLNSFPAEFDPLMLISF